MKFPSCHLVPFAAAALAFSAPVVLAQIAPLPPSIAPEKRQNTVRLDAAQARNFETALSALASQARVAFVAEAAPLHLQIDVETAEKLAGDASLTEMVDKIAAAYDYAVQRRGNVFRLTKRYSDPRDLPALTLEECLQSLEDAVRVTNVFNPRVPLRRGNETDPIIASFLPTLTPDQAAAMADKNKQLKLSDMTPQQRAQIERFALEMYVQRGAYQMEGALSSLKQARGATTLRIGNTPRRTGVLGYETAPDAAAAPGAPLFHPLESADIINGRFADELLTQGQPELQRSPVAAQTRSLGECALQLNARGAKEAAPQFLVDAALAAKPVTVAGTEFASPAALFAALSEVYGLRVQTEKAKNQVLLTRFRFRTPARVTDLPDEVRRVLPAPLLRALHYDFAEISPLDKRAPAAVRQLPLRERATVHQAFMKRRRAAETAYQMMRKEGVRQLRETVTEHTAKNKQAGGVAVSALNVGEESAFAVVLLAEPLGTLANSFGPQPPEYIARFNDLFVNGGRYLDEKDQPRFQMHLAIYDDERKVMRGLAGSSNIYISSRDSK